MRSRVVSLSWLDLRREKEKKVFIEFKMYRLVPDEFIERHVMLLQESPQCLSALELW